MKTADKLPIELIYQIVSCLGHRNDETFCYGELIPPGLAACSLVCRSWNEICRHHIFHTVAVNYGQNAFSRLSFLQFSAPHLCRYMLNLDMCLDINYDTVAEWVPECISRFTNLCALRLDASFISGPILDVLPNFGIMSLLSSARLKELVLAYLDVDEGALDILPILLTCSTTLESLSLEIYEVYEQEVSSDQTDYTPRVPLSESVRLDALRNVKINENACRLPHTNLIECPNLKSLTIEREHQRNNDPWDIPPWIPPNLSELILNVSQIAAIPDLGTSIYPSALTINVFQSEKAPLVNIIAWIGDCVKCLPYPNRLRQLTIKIDLSHVWGGQSYPEPVDYEALYRIIQPLRTHGALQQISISIGDVDVDAVVADDGNDDKAAAKFEEVFAPMLEEISAVVNGGFQRITCKYGGVDVLMRYV